MLILALSLAALLSQDSVDAPGHWPQWRGPNRDNLSAETGLLKEWPEGGPKLLWSTTALGDGLPPVSIGGGRIYGLGYRDKSEYVTSLDASGKVVWSVPIGPQSGEFIGMRFLSQRPVTLDDDRLYAFTAAGVVLCLKCLDGSIVWKRDYSELGSGGWGFFASDAPMVDGKLLICQPGGNKGHVAALDKLTGKTVWQSSQFKDRPSHAPLLGCEIERKRQYIVLTGERVAGIAADTGALLWSIERTGKVVVTATPIYHDGIVFVSSGFSVGCNAYQITLQDNALRAKEIYAGKQLESHRGGILRVGDYLYGTDPRQLQCVELKTGNVLWQERSVGKGSLTFADGHLIVWGESTGTIALVDASPDGYHETGRLVLPEISKEPSFHPVVAGGRLYLRDPKNLFCYDLRGPDYKEPPIIWYSPGNAPPKRKLPVPPGSKTDAAFVPTPNDVVKRMLELAKVGKDDVVYDLGSGDGRIVIASARDYGCKAVGFEIDPDLVKQSRFDVTKAKLDSLVTIEDKDLFKADLSGASVVTLYLGAENNARLLPQLRKLKPKSRIVSHQHRLGEAGPEPDERIIIVSNEDPDPHVVYLWITPLKE